MKLLSIAPFLTFSCKASAFVYNFVHKTTHYSNRLFVCLILRCHRFGVCNQQSIAFKSCLSRSWKLLACTNLRIQWSKQEHFRENQSCNVWFEFHFSFKINEAEFIASFETFRSDLLLRRKMLFTDRNYGFIDNTEPTIIDPSTFLQNHRRLKSDKRGKRLTLDHKFEASDT